MKYKLAKELKDAGFPQGCLPFYCDECRKDQYNDEGIDGCDCFLDPTTKEPKEVFPTQSYIPHLSELIHACNNLTCLKKTAPDRGSLTARWIAEAWPYLMDAQTTQVKSIGDTPEEAVAKLWLELHKK